MRKRILTAAVLATSAVAVVRRSGPTLAQRGMKMCHETMGRHMFQEGGPQEMVKRSDGDPEESEPCCQGMERARSDGCDDPAACGAHDPDPEHGDTGEE